MRRIFSRSFGFPLCSSPSIPSATTGTAAAVLTSSAALFASSSICKAPLSAAKASSSSSAYANEAGFSRASDDNGFVSASDYDSIGGDSDGGSYGQSNIVVRDLSPAMVLKTLRQDPGMTTSYYAKRYFGATASSSPAHVNNVMAQLNHVLWTDLKRFGKVEVKYTIAASSVDDSSSSLNNANSNTGGEATWHPLRAFRGRPHSVSRHRAEDEDLTLLEGFVPQIPDFLKGNDLPMPPKIPTIGGTSAAPSIEAEAARGL